MVGYQTLPIENASGSSLLQLQCAAEHCHEERHYLRTTFLSLFLDKGIKLHALHICRETLLLWVCLRTHYALRTDKCDMLQSTGILETLRNTSAQSFI